MFINGLIFRLNMTRFGPVKPINGFEVPTLDILYSLAVAMNKNFTVEEANAIIEEKYYEAHNKGHKTTFLSILNSSINKCISENNGKYTISPEHLIRSNISDENYDLKNISANSDLNTLIATYVSFSMTPEGMKTSQKIKKIISKDKDYLTYTEEFDMKNIYLKNHEPNKQVTEEKKYVGGLKTYLIFKEQKSSLEEKSSDLSNEIKAILKIILENKKFMNYISKLKVECLDVKKGKFSKKDLKKFYESGAHIVPLLEYVVNSKKK